MALGCRGLSLCELHDKEASSKRDVRLRFHGNQRVLADTLYRMYSSIQRLRRWGGKACEAIFDSCAGRGTLVDQGHRWEEPASGNRERKARARSERRDG